MKEKYNDHKNNNMETIKITRYQSPVGEMIVGSYGDKLCICDWAVEKTDGGGRRVCKADAADCGFDLLPSCGRSDGRDPAPAPVYGRRSGMACRRAADHGDLPADPDPRLRFRMDRPVRHGMTICCRPE